MSNLDDDVNDGGSLVKRSTLQDYCGQRVNCSGFYKGQDFVNNRKIATLENIEVKPDDGSVHFIPYTYVQRAEAITNESPIKGDEIVFTAVVHEYEKKTEKGDGTFSYHKAYGLSRPSDVEVMGRSPDYRKEVPAYRTFPTFLPPNPPPAPVKNPVSVLEVFRKVKALKSVADVETLRNILPKLDELKSAVEDCGGPEAALELLAEMGAA